MKKYILIFLVLTSSLAFGWTCGVETEDAAISAKTTEQSMLNMYSNGTTLYIYSNVTGFQVWYDGRHIFTTPPDKDWCWFSNVSSGRHTITLKKSGCSDATVVVNIVANAKNEVTIHMNCRSSEPKDSDGDGIDDDEDGCYNPGCKVIDSQGCPKDSDGDNVDDCDDDCKYEEGSASNDGCPETKDRDNDGITDDRDSCYNPGCKVVDSQGCPKDYDGDGVTDCDDECLYDAGPVSNDGCPEDPSSNILEYWWVIVVLIGILAVIIYMNQKSPPKLKM